MRAGLLGVTILALAALAGCGVPIEIGLDDAEANRVFLALDRAGVDATKEPDPATDGRWRVTVAREDVARALVAMRDEGLPRRDPSAGPEESSKGSLVPSEEVEHAQLLARTASDLRATLESVEGILAARVHLGAAPAPAVLREAPGLSGRPSASVFIEHRGATPPLSADSVARLVSGAVAGLSTTDVAVVMLPRPAPAAMGTGTLAHVGPIAVARSSARRLQAALAALVALAALLAGAVVFLWSRLAHLRARGEDDLAADHDQARDTKAAVGLSRGT
jgi:type III secretion protein J